MNAPAHYPVPLGTLVCEPLVRSVRFPMRRDRKTKAKMPMVDGLADEPGRAAWCVREAIGHRVQAERRLAKAAILDDLGDTRGVTIERRAAACDRQSMRLAALWARCWAAQILDRDPRILAIERARHDLVWRSFRAVNLSERWRRVQAHKFTPRLDDATRQRIDRLLVRIARRHAAIEPWGYTLPGT